MHYTNFKSNDIDTFAFGICDWFTLWYLEPTRPTTDGGNPEKY